MGTNVRQKAIQTIATANHELGRIDFRTTHIKDLFGVNVFSEEEQKARLPKPVFKALQKTIKQGAQLTDPTVADVERGCCATADDEQAADESLSAALHEGAAETAAPLTGPQKSACTPNLIRRPPRVDVGVLQDRPYV